MLNKIEENKDKIDILLINGLEKLVIWEKYNKYFGSEKCYIWSYECVAYTEEYDRYIRKKAHCIMYNRHYTNWSTNSWKPI